MHDVNEVLESLEFVDELVDMASEISNLVLVDATVCIRELRSYVPGPWLSDLPADDVETRVLKCTVYAGWIRKHDGEKLTSAHLEDRALRKRIQVKGQLGTRTSILVFR